MSTPSQDRAVVAGVDASEAAFRAVRFAAEEAVRRSVPLRIIHAVTRFAGITHQYPEHDVPGQLNAGAQSLLRSVADGISDKIPATRLSTSIVDGDPVDVLLEVSADASLVVVGGVTGDRDQVTPFEAIRAPQLLTGHDRCFIFIRPGLLRGWRATARDVEHTSARAAADDTQPC
jgi:nucleotide-binding universal stress UspA family protein